MSRSRVFPTFFGYIAVTILFVISTANYLPYAEADSDGTLDETVYLPLINRAGGIATPAIDGITLEVDTPFLPGEFSSSAPDDASQISTASSLDPFQEFSIISVAYGTSAPIEDLPTAVPGGAETYRAELAAFRSQQGGTPTPAPAVSLFGQTVAGSYTIVDLTIGNVPDQSTLIVEWVVEAESRIWIVRITRSLGDGSSAAAFVNALSGLEITITGMQPGSTSDQTVSTIPGSNAAPVAINSTDAVPVPPWWNGNCNAGDHSGSYPLGASFDGLVACGPVKTAKLVNFFPGAWGEYEWQCVELAMRYLYLKYSINPYQANGKDVVNNMPSNYIDNTFERIANGTLNSVPSAGDVISFGASTTFGHVAVVTAANVDGNGNGFVTIIEQNWSAGGQRTLPVTGWRIGGSLTVDNWLHADELNMNNPPFIPSNPDPASASNVPPGDIVLSWDGGDPDGDSVVYDLYLAGVPCIENCGVTPPPEAFNLVASGLTEPTYDGYADFDWVQYWQIVAKDEHGLESVGPIWSYYGYPCLDPDFPYCR